MTNESDVIAMIKEKNVGEELESPVSTSNNASNAKSVSLYDPMLTSVFNIYNYYLEKRKQKFDKSSVEESQKFKKLLNHVKQTANKSEIAVDQLFITKMLDAYPNSSNEEDIFSFLEKIFNHYFLIKTYFILDKNFTNFSLIYPESEPDKLFKFIGNYNEYLRTHELKNLQNDSKSQEYPNGFEAYFIAIPQPRLITDLPHAEKLCLHCYETGIKNAVFLQIYLHRILQQKNQSSISPEIIGNHISEALLLLNKMGIPQNVGAKILSDENFLLLLIYPTTRTIRVLRKLLEKNDFDTVRTVPQEIWQALLSGEHSLDFLGVCTDINKLIRLYQLDRKAGVRNSSALLISILCNSQATSLLTNMIQDKTIPLEDEPSDISSIRNFLINASQLTVESLNAIYKDFLTFLKYYPNVLFQEFFENHTHLSYFLSKFDDSELQELSKKLPTFSTLMNVIYTVIQNVQESHQKYFLGKFHKFLISDSGRDLLEYFKKAEIKLQHATKNKSKTTQKKERLNLIGSQYYIYFIVLSDISYQYLKKAGFTIPQILKLSCTKLKLVDSWINHAEFLFFAWSGNEIKQFVDSIKINSKTSNRKILENLLSDRSISLKDSQGNAISYQEFRQKLERYASAKKTPKISEAPATFFASNVQKRPSESSLMQPSIGEQLANLGEEIKKIAEQVQQAERENNATHVEELKSQAYSLLKNALKDDMNVDNTNKRPRLGGKDEQ